MLHRNKRQDDYHFGKWNGLGGKLLPGETPEEAARREIEEESGLVVGSLELKGVITFPLFDSKDDWYVFVFNAYEPRGILNESQEGELHWIETKDITKLCLWPGDRIFLPWLDEHAFFSAKFSYRAGELLAYSVNHYQAGPRP